MKCQKNKLMLNEITSTIQGFYFLVKFSLVLIYIPKVYRKKSSLILLRINFFNFSFEKHAPTLSTFFSETYLSQIVNYWGSIFTLRLTWGAFSLVCVVSVFFFFLSFFFLFSLAFYLTNINDSQDSRDGRGNHYFCCSPLPLAHEHSFS